MPTAVPTAAPTAASSTDGLTSSEIAAIQVAGSFAVLMCLFEAPPYYLIIRQGLRQGSAKDEEKEGTAVGMPA